MSEEYRKNCAIRRAEQDEWAKLSEPFLQKLYDRWSEKPRGFSFQKFCIWFWAEFGVCDPYTAIKLDEHNRWPWITLVQKTDIAVEEKLPFQCIVDVTASVRVHSYLYDVYHTLFWSEIVEDFDDSYVFKKLEKFVKQHAKTYNVSSTTELETLVTKLEKKCEKSMTVKSKKDADTTYTVDLTVNVTCPSLADLAEFA